MNPTVVVGLGLLEVVLILFAGTVAATETAFTRVSRSRAEALAAANADDHGAGDAPDDRIDELRDHTRRPLTTLASLALVQLSAQAGAFACGWFIGRDVGGRTGSVVAVVVTAVALFAVITLSRTRSLLAPDKTAVRAVPILRLVTPLGALTRGIVRLARRFHRPVASAPEVDEHQVLAIVGATSAIDPQEEALIKRVVAFDDTTVGAIMTPRTDMITLRSGFAVRDALQVAALHGLSRIPVTAIDGDIDDILGAVHVKDLMLANLDDRGEVDIDLWLRDVQVVPAVQRAAQLLDDLKTSDLHLAVVVDEHGGVAGLVTLEDILEELVGEIEDEFDTPEPEIAVVDARTIRVDGRCEIGRIEEALGVDLRGVSRTIAGCVFNGLGRVPDVGDVLHLDDPQLELEVIRMHGRRIADVEVRTPRPIASRSEPVAVVALAEDPA